MAMFGCLPAQIGKHCGVKLKGTCISGPFESVISFIASTLDTSIIMMVCVMYD